MTISSPAVVLPVKALRRRQHDPGDRALPPAGQISKTGEGETIPRDNYDDYTDFLEAGSAGAYAEANGFRQLPWWNRFSAHPAYDSFWQHQALDKLLVAHPSNVPETPCGRQPAGESGQAAVAADHAMARDDDR
ncbi:MAG: hypothetical protein WDW36_007031 [Sanguina aurantia]